MHLRTDDSSETVEQPEVDDESHDDELYDDEWVTATRTRSRTRTSLLVALGVAVVFLAGAQVQQRLGGEDSSVGAFPGAGGQGGGAGGLPAGFQAPDGLTLPEGGLPGGAADAGGGPPADGSAGDGSTSDVIGTVVSRKGRRLVVEDLGGNRRVVELPAEVTVVREQSIDLSELKAGDTVDVSGDTITLR